jgi:phage repressor protein C with HTH and peptisase S24 domain
MDAAREFRTDDFMEKSTASAELKRLRERAGMSVREVAAAIDRPSSTYASYEDKFKREFLPVELIRSLIPVFGSRGVPSADLWKLAGVAPEPDQPAPSIESPARPAELPAQVEMVRDVPVLGIASCGPDGIFAFESGTIDFVRRPPRLRGIADAYALYVQGSSMSPWREEGQLVYVHPKQPVRNGDYVVVQIRGREHPEEAYIKRLSRRTPNELRLEQFNPAKEISIPHKRVAAIHRIIDWSELLGI